MQVWTPPCCNLMTPLTHHLSPVDSNSPTSDETTTRRVRDLRLDGQVKCPVPCTEVTLTGGTEVGDLSTKAPGERDGSRRKRPRRKCEWSVGGKRGQRGERGKKKRLWEVKWTSL